MDRTFLAAAALTTLSLVGYGAGVAAPYPGREASIAGLMIGVTLAAVTYGRTETGTVTGGTVDRADGGTGTARTSDAGGTGAGVDAGAPRTAKGGDDR